MQNDFIAGALGTAEAVAIVDKVAATIILQTYLEIKKQEGIYYVRRNQKQRTFGRRIRFWS